MPSRSTSFQAIVHLMRRHFAAPGVTVEESKHLTDSLTGAEPEVDVVVEGQFDGEPMIISIEVTEGKRRADVTWVHEMLRKHLHLPTNRLLLVSKSGFTALALRTVEEESGRVQALTPELVTVDGQVVARKIYLDEIRAVPNRCTLVVQCANGKRSALSGEADDEIQAVDGQRLGTLRELAEDILRGKEITRYLTRLAHNHPERDQVTHFSSGHNVGAFGFYIQHPDVNELCLIGALELVGEFGFRQTEVVVEVSELGGRHFGSAETPIDGKSAVWVVTTDPVSEETKISFRFLRRQAASARPVRFPAVLDLPAPRDPNFPE